MIASNTRSRSARCDLSDVELVDASEYALMSGLSTEKSLVFALMTSSVMRFFTSEISMN